MPDVTPEAPTASNPTAIRADIAKMVGLEPAIAAEIAKQRDQEAEVIRTTKKNGIEAYDQLSAGQEIDAVKLGVGQFDLSPTNTVNDLVPNLEKRIHEINPAPPQEHIKLFLDSFATKALDDKNFEAAVACYNYITDEQLTTEENRAYLEKLASAATTPDEKYDLYLALQQVLPQPPQPQVFTAPATVEPEAAATTPASAESIAADEAAWRAAAGIDTITDTPETSINAPLQPDTSILSYTPPAKVEPQQKPEIPAPLVIPTMEPLTQPVRAEVPPPPALIPVSRTTTEQPWPQPQPITVPNVAAPKPFESTLPAANINASNLRPVPTREEAAAQGLIEDVASRIPNTPPSSSSEAELARAA